jgi:hypothetical protein
MLAFLVSAFAVATTGETSFAETNADPVLAHNRRRHRYLVLVRVGTLPGLLNDQCG